MIIIHAELQVHPEKTVEFLSTIQPLITASQAEEGNLSYRLMKDTVKPATFMMVEVWQDEAAVKAHNESEHFQAFVAKAGQFLTAPLQAAVFNGESVQ